MTSTEFMKKYLAECIGSFALVFCGTGAIIINDLHPGQITHVGIAITFGLIVTTMIYTFGDISGAHFNPAVSIAFWFSGRFPAKELMPYIFSQIVGALVASGSLKLLFPSHLGLGNTIPSGHSVQSFVLEFILTFLLMHVIMNVSTGSKEKGIVAGLVIGFVVLLEAMFAGPVSGASMNPARSLAPAVFSAEFRYLWIYILAPVLGALMAILSWRAVSK